MYSLSVFHYVHQKLANCVCMLLGIEHVVYSGFIWENHSVRAVTVHQQWSFEAKNQNSELKDAETLHRAVWELSNLKSYDIKKNDKMILPVKCEYLLISLLFCGCKGRKSFFYVTIFSLCSCQLEEKEAVNSCCLVWQTEAYSCRPCVESDFMNNNKNNRPLVLYIKHVLVLTPYVMIRTFR